MYRLSYFLLFSYIIIVNAINKRKIEKDITEYFESEDFKSLKEKWEIHKNSIENALEMLLTHTSSDGSLNVYVQFGKDLNKISEGFLVSDNIVNVLFTGMRLTQIPQLRFPEVSFDLPSNMLQLEALVSKMIITTKYLVFRNASNMEYEPNDKFESSPFMRQQVQGSGHATIIAEGCTYMGTALTSFVAQTTTLGHSNFKLMNCMFTLEISNHRFNMPPVIAPYFTEQQGIQLERLLVKPINQAFIPILQGAMFSYVNTSAIFGNLLPKIIKAQRKVKHEISEFMAAVAKNLNMIVLQKNAASQKWDDVNITSFDKLGKIVPRVMSVEVANMSVSGLDSAYSAQIGGAYRLDSEIEIVETIRFASLQLRGVGLYHLESQLEKFVFSGEIQDFSMYVAISINYNEHESQKKPGTTKLKPSKDLQNFEVASWRNLELFGLENSQRSPYALLTGVILNNIPKCMTEHLGIYFSEAVKAASSKNTLKQIPNDLKNDDHSEKEHGSNDEAGASEKEQDSDVETEKPESSGAAPDTEEKQESSDNGGTDSSRVEGRALNDDVSLSTRLRTRLNGSLSDNEIHSD